ncbi:disease resistance protein RPP4-like [Neltuma alba]|uniref:disease resistance protein RPP4-like n=1 Tax=Neltuma alba TaxID=207710 RepID=UPI0010A4C333|nr:disease resistance protein RPP4-like [Prosopis alba]
MFDIASPSSPSSMKYDVFLNFRGEDTRNSFISHLYTALCCRDIETYIDYKLPKGDDISQSLIEAIQNSSISVVVISKDYASSKWCLNELLEILRCKRQQAQIVVPIFYEINPSDVRKQRGAYEKAFAEHLEKNLEKVEEWRQALFDIANLAGWDSRNYRDDEELIQNIVTNIQNIVRDINKKLNRGSPTTIVGIDENLNHIESLLEKFSTIGIWGMGGIGKTTMAEAVFVKLRSQFDSCCFLRNFTENYEKHGLVYVRDELFRELLKNTSLGRLNRKKVLIVLDDVSNTKQFDELKSKTPPLGHGSKVIITSRDKHVLKGIRVDDIHEAKALSDKSSLELFNLNAFPEDSYKSEYEELVKRALAYAKGIPLALTVLGSLLQFRPVDQWESALGKLERMANEDIQEVLKLSYNRLDDEVKEIFLDIACFFKGRSGQYVEAMLKSFGFGASIGLGILVERALISLSHGAGSDAIQGISLDLSRIEKLQLSADPFRKMTNLRFLELYSLNHERSCILNLPSGLESFPNSLRHLRWDNFPLVSFPLSFCAEKLVELHMPRSYLRKLWDGKQDLVNLRNINLRESIKLIELPDLSAAERLEWVDLFACESLCHLHPSILSLPRLEFVDLGMCKNLKSLVTESQSKSLSKLNPFSKCLPLSFCAEKLVKLLMQGSNLDKPWDGMQNFVNLREINLYGCNQLIELPDLSTAQNLEQVDLTRCESLRHLHPSILSLPRLIDLTLRGCRNLKSLKCESQSKSLLYLDVDGCSSLKELSFSSDKMEDLDLYGTCVEILDFSIGPMEKLETLYVHGSTLKNLPINDICYMRSLQVLRLYDCGGGIIDKSKLHVLFDALLSLQTIDLSGTCNLTELPNNIKHLPRLYHLNVSASLSTDEITPGSTFCSSVSCPKNLRILILNDCEQLHELPAGIKHLSNLEEINLSNCRRLRSLPGEITPGSTFCSSVSYLKNLERLILNGCEQLYELPAGIKHLSNLQEIDLSNCRRLRSLPELPPFLEKIYGKGCISVETYAMESAYSSLSRLVYARKRGYICYSGRKAPQWFTLNRVAEASKNITIELPFPTSDLIGFILWSVLQRTSTNFLCELYVGDDLGPWISSSFSGKMTNLDSHQVLLWNLPCTFIGFHNKMDDKNTNYRSKVLFKFRLDADSGDADDMIEEYGVLPIYASKYRNFIQEMELLQSNLGTQKETCADENSFHGIPKYATFSLNQGEGGNFEGSIIPEWFTYKSSMIKYEFSEVSISVRFALDFDNLKGFIFCFVIPQFSSKERHECHSSCSFSLHDLSVSSDRSWMYGNYLNGPLGWHYSMVKLNSDNVFLWYDPLYSELILQKLQKKGKGHDEELEFKFHFGNYYTNDCNSKERNCWIKECGVRPIYASEYTNFFLQQQNRKEV